MKKVIHLIPFDGIGGVESAAQTMNNVSIANIEFEIFYIFKKQVSKRNFLSSLSLKRILSSVFQLYKKKPDLVIVSLWRSCIVAILFKIIRPKTKIVLFLHYPHHYHLADMFFTKIALYICDSVWADSSDTLHSRALDIRMKNQMLYLLLQEDLMQTHILMFQCQILFFGDDYMSKNAFIEQ